MIIIVVMLISMYLRIALLLVKHKVDIRYYIILIIVSGLLVFITRSNRNSCKIEVSKEKGQRRIHWSHSDYIPIKRKVFMPSDTKDGESSSTLNAEERGNHSISTYEYDQNRSSKILAK